MGTYQKRIRIIEHCFAFLWKFSAEAEVNENMFSHGA